MSEFELQCLTSLREHMVAMVLLIDQMFGMPRGSEGPVEYDCAAGRHPVEGRRDASAMGSQRFQCAACKQVVEVGEE